MINMIIKPLAIATMINYYDTPLINMIIPFIT